MLSRRAIPIKVTSRSRARSIARAVGAEIAIRVLDPKAAAFSTISKEARLVTTRKPSSGGFSGSEASPDQFVESVVTADVLAHGEEGAFGICPGGAVDRPGRGIQDLAGVEGREGSRDGAESETRRRAGRARGPRQGGEILDPAKAATRPTRHGALARQMALKTRRHEVDVEPEGTRRRFRSDGADLVRRVDHPLGEAEPRGEVLEVGRGQHHDAERNVRKQAPEPAPRQRRDARSRAGLRPRSRSSQAVRSGADSSDARTVWRRARAWVEPPR